MPMFKSAFFILILVVALLGGLAAGAGAAPPQVPPAQPSPRPPAFGGGQEQNEGSDDDGEPEIHSDLWGAVTDLSTGQAGAGLVVEINGAVVRTDGSGRFSLTGLPAGEYTLRLVLPGGLQPARSQWTVWLDGESDVTVELGYYSVPPPTPTPTPTMVLPQTGADERFELWLIAGVVLIEIGIFIALYARKGKKTQ